MVELSMIKLHSKITHNLSTEDNFVIKISSNNKINVDANNAYMKNLDDKIIIQTLYGEFSIFDDSIFFEENEILLIFPKVSSIKRFFRPNANSNSLLLTEECDQRCIMCSQPPKNKRYDNFSLYKKAVLLMPEYGHLGITGGEPTLFKEPLINFLKDIIEIRNDLTFHILTNGQHFVKEDINNLFILSKNVTWGIPLYSYDEKSHDDIVSKDGAYKRLFDSFNYLLSSGSRVELRTVIMKQNVKHLPKLSELISSQLPWIKVWAIMQLENIGYARMNWDKIFFDNSSDFSNIEKAMSIGLANNINIAFFNFPLCSVPRDYRGYAKNSISDWKNKFIENCDKCQKKDFCTGFFEWHKNDIGYKHIGPEYL